MTHQLKCNRCLNESAHLRLSQRQIGQVWNANKDVTNMGEQGKSNDKRTQNSRLSEKVGKAIRKNGLKRT